MRNATDCAFVTALGYQRQIIQMLNKGLNMKGVWYLEESELSQCFVA